MTKDIAARFVRDIADHEMTVLHEDGLYRHLKCRRPRPASSCYWFELITVPNALIFRGDGESFVFSRIEDMFEFFRDSAYMGKPNYQYWAEKLTTADGERGVMRYDEMIMRQHIEDLVSERAEELPGLAERIESDVLEELCGDESIDRKVVTDFRFWSDSASLPDFEFQDVWEWDLRDYHWWFMWACHAIVWGIAKYDAHKSSPADSPTGRPVVEVHLPAGELNEEGNQ